MKRLLMVAAAGALLAGSAVLGTANAAAKPGTMMTRTIMLGARGGSGVTGTAMFSYNSKTKMTTVTITVKHLKAMSIHPAHIHAGRSCSANGPVLYPFDMMNGSMTTMAGRNGIMTAVTRFHGSFMGKAMYINVHTGPALRTKAQFKVLACGVLM